MRKMIKRLVINSLVMIMMLVSVMVGAADTEFVNDEDCVNSTNVVNYVNDYAGLLTSDETSELERQIADMREKTDWDIFAVTIYDAGGKSSEAYADDFYDECTSEDSDGILILIDMDNREIYISTSGKASRYLADERIERVFDEGFYYVSEGEYASCISAMLSTAEYFYDSGITQDQYNEDVETGAISEYRTLTWMEVVPVMFLAVGVGLAIYIIVVKSYSMKGGRYDYPYMKYGKIDLISQEDRFIRQHVTHHRIQTDNGGRSGGGHSSGRSSTHRSSSGRSHGGGGRRF
ncbi:MAG: TPM domain-containing protein [Roseburia sp.]|nr:TPM domain-containing protein [Roseburia sp.]